MAKIIVDGVDMEAATDANLLEVLLSAGVDIPYFCWHPAMGSIGACRQCAEIYATAAADGRTTVAAPETVT